MKVTRMGGSNNPALTDSRLQAIYDEHIPSQMKRLTIEGVMDKTFALVGITCITGLLSALAFYTQLIPLHIYLIGSIIISLFTLGLCFFICYNPEKAKNMSQIYAACEGVTLGVLTALFEIEFPGIGLQALLLTLAVTFGCLTIYRSNIIKDEYISGKVVMIGLLALIICYFGGFIMAFLDIDSGLIGYLFTNPIASIGVSLVIIAFFCYVLLNDFKTVRQAARHELPQSMEWYFAFSILLTLINIYIEALRLLSKLRKK